MTCYDEPSIFIDIPTLFIGNCMHVQPSHVLVHPTMRFLLDRSGMDLPLYREALRELIRRVYGQRQVCWTRSERHDRLALYKLSNLLGKLELLEDAPVFDLGYRCPEQLRTYHASLTKSRQLGYHAGLSQLHHEALDDLHERVWQILNEVTAFYDGLS